MKNGFLICLFIVLVITALFGSSIFQVYQGGTGATSFTAHGVLIGQGTSPIIATSAGTATSCLISNGPSADPSFQSCGSFAGGGTSVYPAMTKPLAANFSFLNPNSYAATATDKTDRLFIDIPASSLGLAYMQTAALPATPYTIDLGVLIHGGTNVVLAGIALKNSGGNALRTYSFRINAIPDLYFSDQSWTNVTTPGTENNTTVADIPVGIVLFVRITDDGSTRNILTSFNGKDFTLIFAQTHTTGVTPDRAGIIFYNNGVTEEMVMVYHWLISTSVLANHAN